MKTSHAVQGKQQLINAYLTKKNDTTLIKTFTEIRSTKRNTPEKGNRKEN